VAVLLAPAPTLADGAALAALCLGSARVVARMTDVVEVSVALTAPAAAAVAMYHMWAHKGTGNANYVFFQTLGVNVFALFLLARYVAGTVNRRRAVALEAKLEREETEHLNKRKGKPSKAPAMFPKGPGAKIKAVPWVNGKAVPWPAAP